MSSLEPCPLTHFPNIITHLQHTDTSIDLNSFWTGRQAKEKPLFLSTRNFSITFCTSLISYTYPKMAGETRNLKAFNLLMCVCFLLFPLVQMFIIIIIFRLMFGALLTVQRHFSILASSSCWLLLALFDVTFIFKFNSLQLNRFKSPLELEKWEWKWSMQEGGTTQRILERRVAKIS